VKQAGKTMHPNSQTLDCGDYDHYGCQRSEQTRAHADAIICRQGRYSQGIDDATAESELRAGFKGPPQGLHKTQIESTDFIETFLFPKLRKVCIFSYHKKLKEKKQLPTLHLLMPIGSYTFLLPWGLAIVNQVPCVN
jgi:hypothetical protein